jgi:hypothetical protein
MKKDEEHLEASLKESKRQKKERLDKGLNMIRPFTFDEEKIMRDGLRDNVLKEMADNWQL